MNRRNDMKYPGIKEFDELAWFNRDEEAGGKYAKKNILIV
jgi:hypothetical protein